MSNIQDKLKEQLSNELGDKLRSLEMDVTSSFLDSKICSPLLASSKNLATQVTGNIGAANNALRSAGLYITKDGVEFDPSVVVDTAGMIVNSSINLTMSELNRLKNNAIKEITYIPDPSIIMKKAISYFSYNIQNFDLNSLLKGLNISADDKEEEEKEDKPNKLLEKVNEWITYKLPGINDTINKVSSNIYTVTSTATSYMAFGPDWVIDKVTYQIGEGSYIAETFLKEQTTKINDWKMAQYDMVAYEISETLTNQYKRLIEQDLQETIEAADIAKSKATTLAKSLIQKANLAIMAKTGIKIPVNKITPENYAKLKRIKKLSSLINLASS